MATGNSPQQFPIPPIPKVPIPDDVAKRVPGLREWYWKWHEQMEDWRKKTHQTIFGAPAP